MDIRVGFGFDVHQLVEGRDLYIGGKKIDSDLGALGHSDADALLHAICDAMLGALNLRDIGYHFADTAPEFKDIDSKILLKNVFSLIQEKGYTISNMDCTVVLEKPKVNPHIRDIQKIIADILKCDEDRISIKATTHEQVDSFGERRAMKAYAVCLLIKQS